MSTPKPHFSVRSLRFALVLAVVCGMSFIGWRVGASAPSLRLVNQLKSWGASMMTAMQSVPVLNVGGITSTFTAGSSPVVIAPNLTLTGPDLDGARVNISTGFSSAQDRLGISGQGSNTSGTVSGLSWNYNTTTGILTFTGTTTAAAYETALRAVTYYNTSGSPTTGTRGIAIGLGAAVAFATTGHFYESVDAGGNITWTAAKAAAEARTYYGLHGYLVTITSAAENTFAFGKINAVGWIGASDVDNDKQWRWMGGPEAGQVFFYQNGYNSSGANSCGSGVSATQPAGGPYYYNWGGGEPNDCCGGCIHQEDYAHFLSNGQWNDYANTTAVTKYVVEYGGSANDPVVSLTGNTSVNVALASANFTVSKSQPAPALTVGQNSTYTITVTNTSTTTAGTTATVKEAIPAGLTLVSATGSGWSCTPSSGSSPVGTIVCTFSGTIAANNGTSTISVVVNPTASGSVTNYVSIEPLGTANAPVPTTCTGANQPSAGCGAPVTSAVNSPPTVASDAGSKLFIGRFGQNAIARANIDGTGVIPNAITSSGTVLGFALDQTRGKIYWTDFTANGHIGRANMDGTGLEPNFISGAVFPNEIAVDAATGQIYWSQATGGNAATNGVWRANADGTGVTQFLTITGGDYGIDVAGGKLYYFPNDGTRNLSRINLDGTGSVPNFLPAVGSASGTSGLAVDLVNQKIYFGTNTGSTIGCANLDGSGINLNFATTGGAGNDPAELAVDGTGGYLYYTAYRTGNIGRVALNGSNNNTAFITSLTGSGVVINYGLDIGSADFEAAQATRTGTYSDPDGNTVTITADIGNVTKTGTSSGAWTWTYTPPDGPVTIPVTITANDGSGGTSTTNFTVAALNVAPTIALTGNSGVSQNATYTLNLGTVTDPGMDTVTAYSINWGDGITENFNVHPTGQIKTHSYTTTGSKTISVSLTDEDGTFTNAGTKSVSVLPVTTIGFHTASGALGNYYNGGTDAAGNSGPNVGVAFPNSTAGGGKIGENALANVPAGFTDAFSCNYIGVSVGFGLSVWSGPNATGTLLASKSYDVNGDGTAFITFSGVAQSVTLGKYSGSPSYDNFTFGSATVGTPIAEPPGVATSAATSVLATTATLNATVNPGGAATTAQFEYGTTTSYGSTASITLSPNNGTTGQSVSANLMGLMGNTTYHFRVTGTNSVGSRNGSDLMFTTPAVNNPPTVASDAGSKLFIARPNGASSSVARVSTDGAGLALNAIPATVSIYGVAVDSVHGKIYYAAHTADRLKRANLDGTSVEENFIVLPTGSGVLDVKLDVVNGYLYWTEAYTGSAGIWRANLDGSGSTQILARAGIYAIALNVAGNKIYYGRYNANDIGNCTLTGGSDNPNWLVTGTTVIGLAVDLTNSKLYWNRTDGIGRANLDGSSPANPFIILTGGSLGIVADPVNSKLFWTSNGGGNVGCANLNGTGVNESLVTGLTQAWFLDLASTDFEGSVATRTGTYSDPDGNTVTISANIGSVTKTGTSSGTWTWAYTPPDGPTTVNVTITATDSNNAQSTTSFVDTVLNVAPTATFAASSTTANEATGTPPSVSFTNQVDPGTPDATTLRYSYDYNNDGTWDTGDGTYASSISSASQTIPASYFAAPAPTQLVVKGRIIDKDGGSTDYTVTITINHTPTAINGPLIIVEDFDYGAAPGTLSGNGGAGFSTAWNGGSYTPTSLSFSNLSTVGGAWNGSSGSRNFAATLAAAGPIAGDFLFSMSSASGGRVQMFGLGGTNNQGFTLALCPSNDSTPTPGVPIVGLQGGGFANITAGAVALNTTYLYRFAYANSSITAWILSAAQYDNFAPGGITDAELNAASIGSGATQVTGRVVKAGAVSSNMANLFTYTFGGSGVVMDRLRMTGQPVGASLVIAENSAINTTVGTLLASDQDAGDTFTYQLVSGTGSDDNNSFTLTGATFNTLKSNAVFDYETKNSYSIRVRVTDGGGLTYETPLTVSITNVNEAPTVANAIPNQNATANSAFSFAFAANTFADVDVPTTFTYTATRGNGSALPAWLTFTPATRTFSGTPAAGDAGTLTVKVTATDDGSPTLSANTTFDIVVAAVPNLSVSKSQPSPSLVTGQNSTYTITVSNSGGAAATTATVKEAIPAGMKLVSATGTNWTCTPASGNPNVGTITCTFNGTIAATNGSSTFSVVVCPTASGNVTNYVSVDPTSGANAPDPTTCTGVNAPTAGCGAPVTSNTVAPGAALDFDGVNASVNIDSLRNAVSGLSAFTMEMWLKPAASGGLQVLWSGDTQNYIQFPSSGTGLLLEFGGTGNIVWQKNNFFTLGAWQHLAFVFDGNQPNASRWKVYKDGTLVTPDAAGGMSATIAALAGQMLLSAWSGGGYNYNGQMDDARFWNRALCADEIQAHLNCELLANETGLLAYYKFNQGIAGGTNTGINTLTDAGPNGRHGTLNNFSLSGATSNWVTPGGVTTGANCAVFLAPEIDVLGNSTSITDGDSTPSTTDDTDFGSVNVASGTVTHTFTIANTGTRQLLLTGSPKVAISGAHASDFGVTLQPISPVAVTNGTTTFTIVFDPSAVGTRTATVTIDSDDCDEAPYDFTIQGIGLNQPPTITAGATATRQQGTAGSSATIATVSDDLTAAGSVVVTATTVPTGITITGITNSSGTVTATVAADCTATLGNNTIVLTAMDGNGATSTANFIVNVTANDPPTVGTYAATAVALSGTVTVTPNAAPADNGTIASVTATAAPNTFTGTLSGNTTTGAVTVMNAGPTGTYTITVTVTDNCGATVTKTFSLMVDMCAPAPSNLGLWYRAEGNANAFVGGVNATTATNSGQANPTSPTYATGKVGQAWSFNGTTNALDSGATAILNTFPVTIEAWVNPALRNDAGTTNLSNLVYPNNVISNDKAGFFGHGFGVNVTPDGSQFTIEYNDGFRVVPQANASFTAGQWYHVVVVYGLTGNQGSFKAYVNGQLVDQLTYAQGVVDGLSLIRLGYHNDDNGYGTRRFFKGLLDEVSIYQGCALQLSDIQALYQAGAAGKCLSPLNLNTPPTITSAGTLSRSRGSSAVSTIATVSDTETAAGSLTVAVQSAPTGITVTNIQNNNGMITATVAADCTATLGNNTVVLYVSDGACATPFANLIVNVTANTAPTVGTYANTGVAAGGTVTVTPDAAPMDNGAIASVTATASPNTFTGTLSGNTTTGAVTVMNAGPSGAYTITVTVTDNCGAMVQRTFTLTVNTAPTISANATTQQQGVPGSNSTIASVSDQDQAAQTLTIKVNGNGTATVNGVTVSNLAIAANGAVTADVVADCAATLGNASFTLTVSDNSNATNTAMLVVTVTANTPPTLGNYTNTGPINVGAGTTVTPSAAPADNVSVVSASASASNFTGTFAVDKTTGVVTITNAGPPGTYTVNVKVTDNCNEMTIKSFQLVVNGAPTVTPGATLTRQQGTAASNSTLATLGDDLTSPGSLTVMLVSAPAGLNVTNLVNNSGTVTANVAADCLLAAGPQAFVIKATDAGGLETQATINVTVAANTAPVLSYQGQVATAGQPLTVNPATGPSDNGSVSTIAVLDKGTFTGTVSVDNTTGIVTLGNANPTGTHTIMIRATDNCGLTRDASFTVAIGCPLITVGPSTLAGATTGESYAQMITQTGGIGATSFSLSVGTLPNGLTLSSAGLLSGTPTQTGSFPITVRATDSNQCFGETQYTLVVTCPATTFAPTSANSPTALPAAVAGQAYSQTFSVTPARTYNFTVSAGTLPNGLTLNATSGLLTGAPLQTGTFNFTVKAKDQYNCESTHDYSLSVGCQSYVINPATLPGGQAGVPYSQAFSATGSIGAVSFSVNSGTLPTGLTLSNGVLSGTPTALGSFTFELKATDGNGCTAFRTYSNVQITCPTFTLSALPAATAGTAYNQSLSVTPNIGGPHGYSFSGTLPPGLTLTSAGVLSGTPTTAGTYNFTVNVTGSSAFSGCAGSKAYSLVVNCPTITLTASLSNGVQGTSYNKTVVASPSGTTYSYSVASGLLPPGLSLNSATGALTGTPGAPGAFAFAIKATGWGTCSKTQSYTMLITGTCNPLTLMPATLPSGAGGAAYNQIITVTGGAGPFSFAVTQGVLPAGLTLNASSGELSGTPAVGGTFSFRITATAPGGCTGSRNYVLTLGCPTYSFSPAGLALPDATRGMPYTQPITVTPASNFVFSILLGQLPHGFTLNAQTGVISGITDQMGLFNFTIKVLGGSCQATKSYSITVRTSAAALAQINDYDGDGKSDLALHAANGEWRLLRSSDEKEQALQWGLASDLPLSGDYDGDGKTDLAVFRPSEGAWYIKHSLDGSVQIKVWGLATDVPVPGDYDGDGKTDLAVWRGAEGNWYILYSGRSSDQQYEVVSWGAGVAPYNDLPVPGDYDGDGKTDLAVFRRSVAQGGVWYVRFSGNGSKLTKQWGIATDVPVVNDYDGDGKADLAVWRGAEGVWYILSSSTGTARTQTWGAGYAPYFDQALPGDYDGDGQADLAVWRTSSATWYLLLSAQEAATATRVVGQGQSTDNPVSVRRP